MRSSQNQAFKPLIDEIFVCGHDSFVSEGFFDLFINILVNYNERSINMFSFLVFLNFKRIEQFLTVIL